MDAPISSVFSEIYLQFMEHTQLYATLTQNNILGYFRYIDDFLIVYNESSTNIDTLLDCFNSAIPAMTFPIEKELDNSINFLDITIHKKAENFSSAYTESRPQPIPYYLMTLATHTNISMPLYTIWSTE